MPPFCREYIPTLHRGKMAAHTSVVNKKRILRLKYLRSKYRLELWAGCKSNILHRNAQLFVRQLCEHTAQSVPSGGKLWKVVLKSYRCHKIYYCPGYSTVQVVMWSLNAICTCVQLNIQTETCIHWWIRPQPVYSVKCVECYWLDHNYFYFM